MEFPPEKTPRNVCNCGGAVQVLLLEGLLVLLQRVDDRLVLKCQSTNQQAVGADYKYTHSPVLKLQNLLARNVATGGQAFLLCYNNF